MRQPFGETLVAGDTWNWNLQLETGSLPTSPVGGTLKYFLRGPQSQTLDLAGTIGSDGTVNITASPDKTSALVGDLTWQLCFFDVGGARTELARGTVTVLPDVASKEPGFDGRSLAKRMLDAINAVLEGRASRIELEYQIHGRHLRLLSHDELLQARGNYQALYDRELVASGQKKSGGNQIRASFGPRTRVGEWK